MPWCKGCDRYLAPPTVTPDGACPVCRQPVSGNEVEASRRAPWHFKLLVTAAGAYLAMRGIQGVGWVIQQIP